MDGTEYMRKMAQRCFSLAGRCYHLEVARDLRRMGDELSAKAAQVAAAERAAREAARPVLTGRRYRAAAKLSEIAARIAAFFRPFAHGSGAESRWRY